VADSPSRPSLLRRLFHPQDSGRHTRPPRFLRVHNTTRETTVGDRIEVADTAARRNKGLLGRAGLEPGEGLWIVPCEAVHTFAMKFALDLIYLDRKHRVVKVRESVRPGRISGAFRAHSVIELPTGSIAASQTHPGDLLQLDDTLSARPDQVCSRACPGNVEGSLTLGPGIPPTSRSNSPLHHEPGCPRSRF
jgi:uncharacterized membrane protein (UPF0127 family)